MPGIQLLTTDIDWEVTLKCDATAEHKLVLTLYGLRNVLAQVTHQGPGMSALTARPLVIQTPPGSSCTNFVTVGNGVAIDTNYGLVGRDYCIRLRDLESLNVDAGGKGEIVITFTEYQALQLLSNGSVMYPFRFNSRCFSRHTRLRIALPSIAPWRNVGGAVASLLTLKRPRCYSLDVRDDSDDGMHIAPRVDEVNGVVTLDVGASSEGDIGVFPKVYFRRTSVSDFVRKRSAYSA
jgi:hypothetical protein